MTLEVGVTHLISFAAGIVMLWLKNYIGAAAKEEGIIQSKKALLPELSRIEETLTGAKIQGKLDKLDKLEIIEKTLIKANLSSQIENIDKILELAETNAEGNHSKEFKYSEKKKEIDILKSFSKEIIQLHSDILIYQRNFFINVVYIFKSYKKTGVLDKSTFEYFFETDIKLGAEILQNEMTFKFHFKNHKNEEFNKNYLNWIIYCSKIQKLIENKTLELLNILTSSDDLDFKLNKYNKWLNDYKIETKPDNEFGTKLKKITNSTPHLIKTIKEASHNTDYV